MARWSMRFLPTSEEIEDYRAFLGAPANRIQTAVETTDDTRALWHMRRDLLAPHRSPSPYRDHEYPESGDRAIMLAHLDAIRGALADAGGARALNSVRSQLIGFSFVLGDEAFSDVYGSQLGSVRAPAGRYRVTLEAGESEAHGWVTVREDPNGH